MGAVKRTHPDSVMRGREHKFIGRACRDHVCAYALMEAWEPEDHDAWRDTYRSNRTREAVRTWFEDSSNRDWSNRDSICT